MTVIIRKIVNERIMDYEKKYKDMVQRARELYESGNALTRKQMEIVCPELTESEDERIRKMLIEQMERWKKCAEDNNVEQDIKDASDALAYLEKQKEQKPGDEDRYMEGYMRGIGEQQPAEWSEEDEIKLGNLLAIMEGKTGVLPGGWKLYADWLKSLRPQPRWKPSEEQPEMDLEKEIARFALNGGTGDNTPTIGETAHYFYELGLNARKEE